MANTPQEVEAQILQALAECIDADELRNVVFGKGKLLDQYLQFSPNNIDHLKQVIEQVFQRLQDLRFDEFKDREFANWRRVRASVEHENNLINHRLSWLFSSQAFLFTTFILVFNAWKSSPGGLTTGSHFPYLLSIISVVGIFICLSIQRGLNAAEDQLRALDQWWHGEWDSQSEQYIVWKTRDEHKRALAKRTLKHPPLQWFTSYVWWERWFTYSVVPAFFLIAWALIVVLIIFDLSSPVVSFLTKQGFLILSYVVVGVVVWVVKGVINRIRANP